MILGNGETFGNKKVLLFKSFYYLKFLLFLLFIISFLISLSLEISSPQSCINLYTVDFQIYV